MQISFQGTVVLTSFDFRDQKCDSGEYRAYSSTRRSAPEQTMNLKLNNRVLLVSLIET